MSSLEAPGLTTDGPSRGAGATFCALMVLVSLVVPANLVLAGPLRSVGSVSRILGLVALALVLLVFVQRDAARATWGRRVPGSRAVLIVFVVHVVTLLGLYGASYRRLMSPDEVAGGTRVLVGAMALAGAGLAVASFVSDRHALRRLMACVAGGAGFSALVGIVQSRYPLDLADTLRLPGLVVNREMLAFVRRDLTRVVGSAGHPIEFTVILAAALPFVLYVATYASTRGRRQLAGFAAALVLLAIPLGVSRSGVLGVAVALLCYGVVWTWRQRLTALAVALAGLAVYRVVQPGVLGTILGLFTNASNDSSITARTTDYPRVGALLSGRELLGIGPGTFQPAVYFVLDNQFLVSYVEGGVLGLVTFALVPLTGLAVARAARRRAVDRATKDAAQAVFAAIAVIAVCATTFDLLSFQQASFLLFVCVGMASAVLVVASRPVTAPAASVPATATRRDVAAAGSARAVAAGR